MSVVVSIHSIRSDYDRYVDFPERIVSNAITDRNAAFSSDAND